MSKKRAQKLVATLLTVCMLIQTYIYSPMAETESVTSSAAGEGYVSINGVNIEYSASLSEIKNTVTSYDEGAQEDVEQTYYTYAYNLTLRSAYTRQVTNTDILSAENGKYTASKDGWYLLELWGGNGATVSGAGQGGKGGHVYAKMWLEKGQVLYYTLGGNGTVSNRVDMGGGVNGDGGGHGNVGSYSVGGGGGYSAVFLFEQDEFENSYGHLFKGTLSEADRTSRYIMIAGGGGGGGAAPGSGQVGTADGGNGGGIGSTSGSISGDGVVSGTYYAGDNGKSSGTSTSFVGRGGTNVPGAVSDSWWGITDAKAKLPDNWFGTVTGEGGAGGSGELRGGAGGAGYAGGSGGIMTSVLISSNVGGGGGGSSFIADEITSNISKVGAGVDTVTTVLSDSEDDWLKHINPDNSTGGALCVTYLSEEDISFLGDLTIKQCYSDYVTPTAPTAQDITNSDKTFPCTYATFGDAPHHEAVKITGVSLLTDSGETGGGMKFSTTLLYSDGFVGGNNVPVFNNHEKPDFYAPVTVTATMGTPDDTTDDVTVYIDLGKQCGYLNMPLKLHVHAHSREVNQAGTQILINSLFYDEYGMPYYDSEGNSQGTIRENLLHFPYQYHFVEEIGEYEVYAPDGKKLDVNEEVAPNTTTRYSVVLPVTIKKPSETGYAAVGTRIQSNDDGLALLRGTARIIVPGSRSEVLGKFLVTYSKKLEYLNDHYVYTLNVHSNTSSDHNILPDAEGINHTLDFDSSSGVVEYDHTIEVDGWYLIQVWGANGAAGGTGALGWGKGAAGGTGGYLSCYVKLNRGQTVDIFMGANGVEDNSASQAGAGGKHTRVSIREEGATDKNDGRVIMVAAGGGGGGAGFIVAGSVGKSVTETVRTGLNPSNEYNTYDGKNASNLTGGAAGQNYVIDSPDVVILEANGITVDSTELDFGEETVENYAKELLAGASSGDYTPAEKGGGTVHVRCLQVADSAAEDVINDVSRVLTDYSVSTEITKYFEVLGVEAKTRVITGHDQDGAAQSEIKNIEFNIDDYTYTEGQNTPIHITDIYPFVHTHTTGEGNNAVSTADMSFDIIFTLKPAEGFMGGNDVPIFADGVVTVSHTQYYRDHEVVPEDAEAVSETEAEAAAETPVVARSPFSRGQMMLLNATETVAAFEEIPAEEEVTEAEITEAEITEVEITETEIPEAEIPEVEQPDAEVAAVAEEETANDDYYYAPDFEAEMIGTPVEKSIDLGRNDSSDHANVVISYEPPMLEKTENFYSEGNAAIPKTDLYTGVDEIPTDHGDDWRYDYIEAVYSITEVGSDTEVADSLTPTHTTEYEVTIGYAPIEKASNAAAVELQPDKTATVVSIIIVGHEVIFDLTELTHDQTDLHGRYVAEEGEDFSFTLTPDEGRDLPDSISIAGGNFEFSEAAGDYFYDRVSGRVVIKADAIAEADEVNGDSTVVITVTAAAKAKSYKIHFVYGETPDATEYVTVIQKYAAGSDISDAFHSTYVSSVEGYDFGWDWGDGSAVPPDVMPDQDLWVTGVYTAKEYTVTVNYSYENGGYAGASDVITVKYGDSYSVSVPEKSGYVPYLDGNIATTVSGTMGAEDVEVTVVYKATSNTLTVVYRYQDGREAYPTETYQYDTDTEYSVGIKTLAGYTQSEDGSTPNGEWTAITGKMTANGKTVVVTYLPNVYTVTFDYNDGGTESTQRSVVFGQIYGYDENQNYQAFDIPTREHYVFEGWYLDGVKISEDSVVDTASHHTLVAEWTPYEYTLTIKYVYTDGAAAYSDYSGRYGYQVTYSVDSPTLHGYTPDKDTVSGKMPGQDFIVTVTYTYNYSGELVIQASVEWDELRFDHIPYTWDYETLTYVPNDEYTPVRTDANKITVKNNGSYIDVDGKPAITVYADFTYSAKQGYETVNGYYTDSGAPDGNRVVDAEVSNYDADGQSVYFWIEGSADFPAGGTYGIGTCTVTIRGGEKEAQ